jgi:hypothetical protein
MSKMLRHSIPVIPLKQYSVVMPGEGQKIVGDAQTTFYLKDKGLFATQKPDLNWII